MRVKKFAKWGLALTSSLVLGGVVTPASVSLLSAPVVYAQEAQAKWDLMQITHRDENGNRLSPTEFSKVYEGGDITFNEATIDGYEFVRAELVDNIKLAITDITLPYTHKYVGTENGYGSFNVVAFYKPVKTPPAETKPVEQPVEVPVEKPVETPTEQPITYRIHYFLNDVAENGGTPSYTDIAPYKEGVIAKGETIVEVAPHIDGYAVAGNNTISVTYDHVAGDNVWHDEDWYPTSYFFYDKVDVPKPAETPTEKPVETPPAETKPVETPAEKPVEQPAEKPVEQPAETPIEQPTEQPAETPAEQPVEQPVETPVEQPTEQPAETLAEKPIEQPAETLAEKPIEQPAEQVVDTPTDKPVEQLTDASSLTDQTAGKAQPVATTDKKKVDTSTPSTSPVASQDTAKTTAKSLPKTGDSGSILLGLGGFLSGLSGLGLAARSRKKD